MCGITAIWGECDPTLIEQIMGDLVHQCPDDSGVASLAKTTLGHRRLSIMDTQGGKQPIWNETKNLAIAANGEIYNFNTLQTPT